MNTPNLPLTSSMQVKSIMLFKNFANFTVFENFLTFHGIFFFILDADPLFPQSAFDIQSTSDIFYAGILHYFIQKFC